MLRWSGLLIGLVSFFFVADMAVASKGSPKTASPEGSSPRYRGHTKSQLELRLDFADGDPPMLFDQNTHYCGGKGSLPPRKKGDVSWDPFFRPQPGDVGLTVTAVPARGCPDDTVLVDDWGAARETKCIKNSCITPGFDSSTYVWKVDGPVGWGCYRGDMQKAENWTWVKLGSGKELPCSKNDLAYIVRDIAAEVNGECGWASGELKTKCQAAHTSFVARYESATNYRFAMSFDPSKKNPAKPETLRSQGGVYTGGGAFAPMWGVASKQTPIHQPLAIYVLGASASGKTFSTKNNVPYILGQTKNWPLLCQGGNCKREFFSVDGGDMRAFSKVWTALKEIATDRGYAGFGDQFGAFFKKPISSLKKTLLAGYSGGGTNCLAKAGTATRCKDLIIPETATGDYRPGKGPVAKQIVKLAQAGYQVVLTGIYADKDVAAFQGTIREREEGKKFSSKSWGFGVYEMASRISHWHKDKNNKSGLSSYIFFNNKFNRGNMARNLRAGSVSQGDTENKVDTFMSGLDDCMLEIEKKDTLHWNFGWLKPDKSGSGVHYLWAMKGHLRSIRGGSSPNSARFWLGKGKQKTATLCPKLVQAFDEDSTEAEHDKQEKAGQFSHSKKRDDVHRKKLKTEFPKDWLE